MGIPEVHRDHFRRFLCSLRQNLSLEPGYSDVISYANEFVGFGVLEGFAPKELPR